MSTHILLESILGVCVILRGSLFLRSKATSYVYRMCPPKFAPNVIKPLARLHPTERTYFRDIE